MEDRIRFKGEHVLQREYGKTPNGNDIDGRWVLRDKEGTWLDFSRYRSDLIEKWGLIKEEFYEQ